MYTSEVVKIIQQIKLDHPTYIVEIIPNNEITNSNCCFYHHIDGNMVSLREIEQELRHKNIEYLHYNPMHKDIEISIIIRNS